MGKQSFRILNTGVELNSVEDLDNYDGPPPQGLSEARRGRLPYLNFSRIEAAAGRPSGRRQAS